MKLEDILFFTNEGTNVNIVKYENNEVISRYNGKDSIDIELNEREAITQYVTNNELYIVVA